MRRCKVRLSAAKWKGIRMVVGMCDIKIAKIADNQ